MSPLHGSGIDAQPQLATRNSGCNQYMTAWRRPSSQHLSMLRLLG